MWGQSSRSHCLAGIAFRDPRKSGRNFSGFIEIFRITSGESGKKKTININILGGTVLGTDSNRPWDKRDLSLGQTGRFLFNSTVKSLFCPVCPWDVWGFVPGTIVPPRPSKKKGLCVLCLLFFSPSIETNLGRTPYLSWLY